MSRRLISYDLIAPGRDYASLIEAIKELGSWAHCLESVWIVETRLECSAIRDRLAVHLDDNDKLLVAGLASDWATWGVVRECTDWLKA